MASDKVYFAFSWAGLLYTINQIVLWYDSAGNQWSLEVTLTTCPHPVSNCKPPTSQHVTTYPKPPREKVPSQVVRRAYLNRVYSRELYHTGLQSATIRSDLQLFF